MFDELKDATLNRRSLLRSAGGFAVGAGALGLLAGCGGNNNDNPNPNPTPSGDASAVLNFALNLEYLEAEYYLRAIGSQLNPGESGTDADNVLFPVIDQVNFSGEPIIEAYAKEIAKDERAHVVFLRKALGSAAVARPRIDLRNSFTAIAQALNIVPAGTAFDPYSSPLAFLIGAFIFEDVGVTAYRGGATALVNGGVDAGTISAAAAILGTEAYHAGLVRTVLFARRDEPVGNDNVAGVLSKISDFRADLGGGKDKSIGNTASATIVPTDTNGLVFERTTTEVINIVTAGGPINSTTNKRTGGFFPAGLNGTVDR